MRLVWVNSETGQYTPHQRRTYACELTWRGYPAWSLQEVGHLIDHCEDSRCKCRLHLVPSPFHVFPQRDEGVRSGKERKPSILFTASVQETDTNFENGGADLDSVPLAEDEHSSYGSVTDASRGLFIPPYSCEDMREDIDYFERLTSHDFNEWYAETTILVRSH